jgi:hypothetical protein
MIIFLIFWVIILGVIRYERDAEWAALKAANAKAEAESEVALAEFKEAMDEFRTACKNITRELSETQDRETK